MTTLFENESISVKCEENEGIVFLHLNVYKWSLSTYKQMKQIMPEILAEFEKNGVEVVFARTDKENITRMWDRLAPLYSLTTFGPRNQYYLGAWETEGYYGSCDYRTSLFSDNGSQHCYDSEGKQQSPVCSKREK